ncbi:amidase family protein [Bradyrhizobium guangxiense]
MQVADIDARNVPELCVETLRGVRIDRFRAADARSSPPKQKMRKQPHAQYKTLKNFASCDWADPASTCGLPATAVPIERTPSGLPIGVQIIGPYLEDRTTIALAGLIEREFGGFVPPPGLTAR